MSTTSNWVNTAGGAWDVSANWSGSVVPNSTSADAVIAASGSYTVTLLSTETITLDALTLDDSGATLTLAGSLDFAGAANTVMLEAGTLAITSTGMLRSGTIDQAGGTLALNGGTFDAVTVLGSLTFGAGQALSVEGGLTVETASGTSPGTIALTGSNDTLSILDAETLSNLTLDLGSNGGDYVYSDGAGLTLGAQATVEQTGLYGVFYGNIINDESLTFNNVLTYFYNYGSSTLDNANLITLSGTEEAFIYDSHFVNSGTIVVGSGSTLTIQGATAYSNSGVISLDSGAALTLDYAATLSSLGSIDVSSGATISVNGTLDLAGGTLDVASGGEFGNVRLNGSGDLADGTVLEGGGTLTLNFGTFDAMTVLGNLTFGAYGGIFVQGGLTVDTLAGGSPGTIEMTESNIIYFNDAETLNNVTIAIGGSFGSDALDAGTHPVTLGAQAVVSQTSEIGYFYGTFTNQGTIALHGGSFYFETYSGSNSIDNANFISIGNDYVDSSVATFDNAGTMTLGGGSFIASGFTNSGSISGFGVIADAVNGSGSITASGGLLHLEGTVGGAGALAIDAGATLELGAATAQTVTFATPTAAGTMLQIGTADTFTGTIDGLATGDTVDLANLTLASASIVGGTLVADIQGGGTQDYAVANVGAFGQIATSGGDIIFQALCFLSGTRIAVPGGEVPVEMLRQGQHVCLADGGTAAIRWLGRSTVAARFADPQRVWPVRIRAGALADGLPRRDLLVSPGHALRFGDILVTAGALVNGTSVVREVRMPERFIYWHVELDTHALLLAEGVEAESYLDGCDDVRFDNAVERPAPAADAAALPYPRAKSPRQIPPRLRAELQRRAVALSCADAAA